MIEQTTQIHLFYPVLILLIVILITAICSTIKFINGNQANKGVVENIKDIFFKSSDNAKEITLDNNKVHIDATSKFKDVTMEALGRTPVNIEQEFHELHTDIKQTNDRFEALAKDINEKLDKILLRVVELEKERQQQNNI